MSRGLNEQARGVHESLKVARAELRAARREALLNPAFQACLKELEQRADVLRKALRAATDAYWGTYQLVEERVHQARRARVDPGYSRAVGFERVSPVVGWLGEGQVGIQLSGGISVAELFAGADTRLRIEPVPDEAWHSPLRGVRRRSSRTRLWLRVGSNGHQPIWAVFPMILHRELPADARIKRAIVSLQVTATTERWNVSITYTQPAPTPSARSGAVALNLGWRQREDHSLRAAYWADDNGAHGELTVPNDVRARIAHGRGIQALEARLFERARRWLSRWLNAARSAQVALPPFLEDASVSLSRWRSSQRLRRLVLEVWRFHRFPQDACIYPALERWSHKSRHLHQWARHEQRRALGCRQDNYRNFAARLADHYGAIVLEQSDLRMAKLTHAPEGEVNVPKPQRSQLYDCAPGELRSTISRAAVREGIELVLADGTGTTTECHACRRTCTWDRGKVLIHECEHCGQRWDQDHNAAVNLLRRFLSTRVNALE